MKRNILITIVFFALFFALFFAYIFIRLPYDRKEALIQEQMMHNMSFKGKIIEITTNRGVSKVKLDNMPDYIYLNNSRNYSVTPHSMADYLNSGMIIYKHTHSDTLYVEDQKTNTSQFFILGNINLNSK